ncbi:NHLP bacteriocin export ABC transporter permease/ATPase subunit [Legionella jordanis]|uniref:ABC transporter n=2 Tax=Legionella jordanis TaxID=456 RepID=A0A0W0VAZ8_9GAMM|nr:NHLP bacteriocin export ABC transporter permease/ATPase subunit [Legionella jordanis]KTD17292.1 ABC transporter [Legionella jordanis]RMW99464.1 NHLP bacteriocin export ABC transporter permease/ATPase subunit [Legionella jordanis]RMX15313.1 NHLP bacteriocin export ABC transporter permease/ATPase subunit [Legionella jordanis]VEH12509.1 ABC transporter [Legionella jordanis]
MANSEGLIQLSKEFDLLKSSMNYFIQAGAVDLFLIPTTGIETDKRYPLFRLQSGELLLGFAEALLKENGWKLLASPLPETWVTELSEADISAATFPQKFFNWAQHFTQFLRPQYLKQIDVQLLRESLVENFKQNRISFQEVIWPLLIKTTKFIHKEERARIRQRKKNESSFLKRAFVQMLTIIYNRKYIPQGEPDASLAICVRYIAQYYQIDIPESFQPTNLKQLTQKIGLPMREVSLKGKWWLFGTHPLLLQKKEQNIFYLALPQEAGSLILFDPQQGLKKKLSQEEAQSFNPIGWQLYCSLPQQKLKLRELIAFAFRGCRKDITRLLIMGVMAAIMSLAVPWFTGVLFDQVVPAGNMVQLQQILMALLVAACAAGLFELARAMAIIRIGSKLNLNIDIAIWDRLIRLPANFFRQFSSGELARRALGASSIRRIIEGVVINSILSGIFSVLSFALLFYYDAKLALIATAFGFIISTYTLLISFTQLFNYKNMEALEGQLSGMIVQLLNGVAKIQSSGREKTVFSLWALKNGEIKGTAYKVNWYHALLSSLNAFSMPVLIVIIFAQLLKSESALSLGAFLAFNAALGQFIAGMLSLTNVLSQLLHSIPLLKRTAPIIECLPEIHAGKTDPAILNGKIEVDHLTFFYSSKEQPVVKDVSFIIEPGQYVAICGPSGSGKSTLLRLLLGFESPQQGHIFFDDHDMKQLNLQRVREQCGVVLQNSLVMPGSLFENIAGSAQLSFEAVWQAAEMAGLAEDIKKMPMGLHTIISERGGTLSGGQRQRVLIARALAKKPRILFFDEATSSLDNLSQSMVSKSLEELKISRLVIAHRLSTIQHANLILVMEQGQIVESGTYDELMAHNGLFARMASRQLI